MKVQDLKDLFEMVEKVFPKKEEYIRTGIVFAEGKVIL